MGIKYAFYMSIALFILLYLSQLTTKRKLFIEDPTLVCDKCNRLKNYDNTFFCDCGGKFVPLDEMKWIDDKNNA